jgi:hypothetical protein
MDTYLSICVGVALSAACGFRVFVPLLITSIAAHTGHVSLAPEFAWLGTNVALIGFAVATCAEIGAYYIPWVDNALDSIATPASVIAGILLTASLITSLDPFFKWSLAIIAGGGAAGMVQSATVVTRGASSAGTGGLANPVIATIELVMSVIVSILAIVVPIVAIALIIGMLVFAGRKIVRRFRQPVTVPPKI